MCAQLNHVGFSHYVAISSGESDCKALTDPHATCVWTTFPGVAQSPAWESERRSTEGLWIQRYHVANLLAAAGANVLLVDLDTMFYRDPYPDLHGPLLGDTKLIHLQEGWSGNGGCFYMQHVKPGSAALWTHTHIVALAMLRVDILARDNVRIGSGMMDQELLNDSLFAAGCNASALFVPYFLAGTSQEGKNHSFWKLRSAPQYGSETALELSPKMNLSCGMQSATAHSYEPAADSDTEILRHGDDTARWEAYLALPNMRNIKLTFLELEVPADAALTDSLLDPDVLRDAAAVRGDKKERYANAPVWVFGHCRDAHVGASPRGRMCAGARCSRPPRRRLARACPVAPGRLWRGLVVQLVWDGEPPRAYGGCGRLAPPARRATPHDRVAGVHVVVARAGVRHNGAQREQAGCGDAVC